MKREYLEKMKLDKKAIDKIMGEREIRKYDGLGESAAEAEGIGSGG